MQRFYFNGYTRKHVENLCNLLEFANKVDTAKWSNQTSIPAQQGVYGFTYEAVMKIVEIQTSPAIVKLVRSRDVNWGGEETWLDDLEIAISEAFVEYEATHPTSVS